MATNEFLPFATDAGAEVDTQAVWASPSGYRPVGYGPGILTKEKLNKALRQSTSIASAVAQLMAENLPSEDILDNGDINTLVDQLSRAVITGTFLSGTASTQGSNAVGTRQNLAGAVDRTQHEKNADFISVKDFGAVGDGVHDDTTACVAAATAALAVGAGLYFPDGRYYINGLFSVPNKVSLYGSGKTTSEIQFGSSGSLRVVGTSPSYVGRLSISRLGLTNQGAGSPFGIQFTYATRITMYDCVVYNTSIQLSAFSYITFENCDLFGGSIQGDHPTVNEISEALKIIGCNGSNFAINVKDTADVLVSRTHLLGPTSQIMIQRGEQNSAFYPPVQIANCIVDSGDDEGIYLIGVAPRISDTFVSSGRTNLKSGVRLNDCIEGSLIGVTARFCGNHGLHVGFSKQIKVLGGHFDDNKVSGVRIGDSSDLTFIGNTMMNQPSWFGGSYPQVNGITDEPSNCTNITCIGNQTVGNTSAQVYLPSATNIIHSNVGYNEGRLTCDSWRNNTDNAASLGTAGARYTVVHAVSGTINTSDANEKQDIEDIPVEWLEAWSSVRRVRFKWKDAVQKKGTGARWHIGLIAQEIWEAFAARGIDAFEIGLLCYDAFEEVPERTVEVPEIPALVIEHPEVPEVLDEDGRVIQEYKPGWHEVVEEAQPSRVVVVQEYKPAGGRYGVRYEEAEALEAAWVRWKLESLQ